MDLFPIFLKLTGRRCLVVGAGNLAESKIESLRAAHADVTVIAPHASSRIVDLAASGELTLHQRVFSAGDVATARYFLVVTATDVPAVNRAVYLESVANDVMCNAVDDPPFCDFYFPSVVKRGDLQIAISTAGASPALAQRLRKEINAQLPLDTGDWVTDLGKSAARGDADGTAERRAQTAAASAGAARGLWLRSVSIAGYRPRARSHKSTSLRVEGLSTEARSGVVYLVGAGPGDPELLTLRALKLIQTADVILPDDLVSDEVLDLASPCAEIIPVGKRCGQPRITQAGIHELMLSHARAERSVVRLKSGDPLIFGRAGRRDGGAVRGWSSLQNRFGDHRRFCGSGSVEDSPSPTALLPRS